MKTVELFAGAGGLGLGLENAGIEHEMLVEIDKDCVATLKRNRPNWNVVHGDVQEIDFKSIKTDIVTGGFPCQAFSYAGKKLGFEDTRGTLFFEFARAVKEIEPKICLAENVEGLVRHDKGRTLKTMISVLENLGYDVQYKVLNAVNFYVPQKRKRMVLVGTRKGINFLYPQPNKKILTIKDALKNVPKSDGTGYSQKREEVLNLVPPGGCWIDLPEDIKKDFMGKSYYSGGGKRGMARRMSWNEPCLTLTTSPSQKQTERCHPEETRPFTIREYARIQTFPDDWEFMGGKSSQYKQIGNAVPVKLGEFLGKQIIKALNGDNSVDSSHQVKLSAF
ncbi:DNA cytosine methyltransferase [Methanobrevibacter curvatus]|uniref:DNA (cytosine-5-)-methyltransferase n=1 Tax=Methanobrevibacter curvatus TaxID=49547 RepID=A0A165Z916_9EURY|nr:DNA cytosine methyltransferase [Methanobrevibacter curvatus]KZX10412.1 modification methylase HpaII [Methanobrevibacter curvatus]